MSPGSGKKSLFPLYVVNFVSTLGLSLVAPFLVTLVNRLGGNALVYAGLGATYSLFQLFGAPLLGRWSDSVGRRKALLVSQIGTLLAWLIFLGGMYLPANPVLTGHGRLLGTLVVTLPVAVMFLSRALDGLTGGSASVASAYLADLSDEESLSANFGKMAVASSLGLIFGPTLGGVLGGGQSGETPAIIAAIAISALAVILISAFLPDSRPVAHEKHHAADHVRKVFGHGHAEGVPLHEDARLGINGILRLPHIGYLLAIQLLVFIAYNLFFSAFPVYVTTVLGWESHHIGYFFSFIGLVTVVVQGSVVGFLSRRLSRARLILLGSVILASGFLLFDDSVTWAQYCGAALFALGNGILWPALTALLAVCAGDRYQGAVQGLSGSVSSVASIVGMLAGGVLFNVLKSGIFPVAAGLVFLVALASLRGVPVEREAVVSGAADA